MRAQLDAVGEAVRGALEAKANAGPERVLEEVRLAFSESLRHVERCNDIADQLDEFMDNGCTVADFDEDFVESADVSVCLVCGHDLECPDCDATGEPAAAEAQA